MGRITGLNKRNWSSGVYKARGKAEKYNLVDSQTVKTPFKNSAYKCAGTFHTSFSS